MAEAAPLLFGVRGRARYEGVAPSVPLPISRSAFPIVIACSLGALVVLSCLSGLGTGAGAGAGRGWGWGGSRVGVDGRGDRGGGESEGLASGAAEAGGG